MSDDRSTFETTRARLEDIVVQVRRKDVSLEQSLDLLEEAVRLVNRCNDLIDQTSFRAVAAEGAESAEGAEGDAEGVAAEPGAEASQEQTGESEGASGDLEAAVDEVEVVDVIVVDDEGAIAVEFVDMDLDGEDEAVMFVTELEDDERS